MAVNSKVNISLENLPIGTVVNMFNSNSLKFLDTQQIFKNTQGYFLRNTNDNIYSIQLGYFSNLLSGFDAPTTNRIAFLYNNDTTYSIYIGLSNVLQVSSNGSSFTNKDITNTLTQNIGTSSANWYSNNINNKVVICNSLYSYIYSNNGIDFNFASSNIVSNLHTNITRPVISGSTYSFWDITNSKRIYTTDHISFSDCVGFGDTNLPIHTMSNGHLYTTTSATLRVSTNNGIDWTSYNLPASTMSDQNHCLDFDGTTYVYGTTTNALYSSTDLTSWTSRTSNISGTPVLQRVWFVNTSWFVFSATSATTSFSTSTDGISWTNRTSPNAIICNAVIYVNSVYMILGSNRVITSSNLVTWTSSIAVGNSDTDALNRTFYGTGTKALILATNVAYFYNAGSWTTVTTSQQRQDLLSIQTTTVISQQIKAR